MPIRNYEEHCRKYGKKYGSYWGVVYSSGNRFIWKRGWKRGLDIPKDETLAKTISEQMAEYGQIKTSLMSRIAARAIFECGKINRRLGREIFNLHAREYSTSPKEEAKSAIFEYWRPRKDEHGMYKPTINQGNLLADFKRSSNRSKRVYQCSARFPGGFKKLVDSIYPGLYREVSYRRTRNNSLSAKQELSKILIERYNSGLAISSSSLQHSADPGERELRRRVLDLSESTLFDEEFMFSYTEIVHKLTGIPAEDVRLDNGSNTHCGKLAETFTKFLFYWSSVLGKDTWNIDNTQWISSKRPDLALLPEGEKTENEQGYEADLRIGNLPIEVKTGVSRFAEDRRDGILKKYGNHGMWESGEPLEKGAIVFHARPSLYEHFLSAIEEAKLQVISYEDFHDHLESLIGCMKKKSSMYRDVRPITNLDNLLKTHEEASLHPYLLVRTANSFRRAWIQEVLSALIVRAQEYRNVNLGIRK